VDRPFVATLGNKAYGTIQQANRASIRLAAARAGSPGPLGDPVVCAVSPVRGPTSANSSAIGRATCWLVSAQAGTSSLYLSERAARSSPFQTEEAPGLDHAGNIFVGLASLLDLLGTRH